MICPDGLIVSLRNGYLMTSWDSVQSVAHFPDAALVSSVHRLHLLDRFDEVILMRAGRIEAVGRAWELAQGSALFRELLAAQAVSGEAPGS